MRAVATKWWCPLVAMLWLAATLGTLVYMGSGTSEAESGKAIIDNSPHMQKVVFFGRSAEESSRMYDISFDELRGKRVLDCPGGPSSFTARAVKHGVDATAVDPIYQHDATAVRRIGLEDVQLTMQKKRLMQQWIDIDGSDFTSLQHMESVRIAALDEFVADFVVGQPLGRYIAAALPVLPFPDDSFDLVLTGNFLFAYAPVADGGVGEGAGAFDYNWHLAAVKELLRVSRGEVRIFPAHALQSRDCKKHPYAVALKQQLQQLGLATAAFYETSYRQGQEGEVVGLLLQKKNKSSNDEKNINIETADIDVAVDSAISTTTTSTVATTAAATDVAAVIGSSPSLHRVVFFGRTAEEYARIFSVNLQSLRGKRLLDCPGGPSSFTARASSSGVYSVAVDPMYAHDASEIQRIGLQDVESIMSNGVITGQWMDIDGSDFTSLQHIQDTRNSALNEFLADFAVGQPLGRYIAAALPVLPFPDDSFDLVLTGNFLFAYAPVADGGVGEGAGAFDYNWHLAAVKELLRVSRGEVRIYPAHTIAAANCTKHPYAVRLMQEIQQQQQRGEVEIEVSFYDSSYRQGQNGDIVGIKFVKKGRSP